MLPLSSCAQPVLQRATRALAKPERCASDSSLFHPQDALALLSLERRAQRSAFRPSTSQGKTHRLPFIDNTLIEIGYHKFFYLTSIAFVSKEMFAKNCSLSRKTRGREQFLLIWMLIERIQALQHLRSGFKYIISFFKARIGYLFIRTNFCKCLFSQVVINGKNGMATWTGKCIFSNGCYLTIQGERI